MNIQIILTFVLRVNADIVLFFFPLQIANGTTHYYAPIPNGFQPGSGGAAAPYPVNPHGHMAPPPPGTPQPTVPPPQHQQQMTAITNPPPPPQQQHSPASHSANHSPSPPNNNYHKDERTQRQHSKLLRKLEKQREYSKYNSE